VRRNDFEEAIMTGKLVVGIAGLAAFVSYCFWRGQGARESKREAKEDLGRWEGEGGNVPAVATPSPAAAQLASFPAQSDVRH
jgi:hypothetical protein